ncbi:MAG: hypothetical protein ACR2OZ_07090 [Verrucomicrobiales bacterium]
MDQQAPATGHFCAEQWNGGACHKSADSLLGNSITPRRFAVILPPRIIYSADTFELHPLPGLSSSTSARFGKTPRALHRLDRHGKLSWQDAHGDIVTAS